MGSYSGGKGTQLRLYRLLCDVNDQDFWCYKIDCNGLTVILEIIFKRIQFQS